ncbi:MAG: YfhO family protein [Candidatus Hydrogenedentota bacterium]
MNKNINIITKSIYYEVIILIIITIIFHINVLFKPLIQPSDAYNVYAIFRHQTAELLKRFQYPVWDPYHYGGVPWPAGIGVISLWNIPYFFLPISKAETSVNYIQFFLLLFGMCRFLRILGRSFIASILFAVLFMCTGPVIFFYGYSPVMNGFITFIWILCVLHLYDKKKESKYLFFYLLLVALHFLDMSYHHSLAFVIYIFFDRLFWGRYASGVKNGFLNPVSILVLGFMVASVNWMPLLESILATARLGVKYNETFLFSFNQLILSLFWGPALVGEVPYPPLYLYFNHIIIIFFILSFLKKFRNETDSIFYIVICLIVLLHIIPGYLLSFISYKFSGYDPFRLNLLLSIIFTLSGSDLLDKLLSFKTIQQEGLKDGRSGKNAPNVQLNRLKIILIVVFLLFNVPVIYAGKTSSFSAMLIILCLLYLLLFYRKTFFRLEHIFICVIIISSAINIDYSIINGYIKNLVRDFRRIHQFLDSVKQNTVKNSKYKTDLQSILFYEKVLFLHTTVLGTAQLPLLNLRTLCTPNTYAPSYVIKSYIENGLLNKEILENFWEFQYPNAASNNADILADFGIEWILVHSNNIKNFNRDIFRVSSAYKLDHGIYYLLQNLKYSCRAFIYNNGSREKTEIVKDDITEIVIKADSVEDNGLLVFTENYYPGWEAYVNEKEVSINLYKGALKSVYLDKGENIVRFIYRPIPIMVSFFISLISYLAGLYFILVEENIMI